MKRGQDAPGIVRRRLLRRQSGFALIVALLTLLLLTFLGLTLAATTSTELQIATNYRWGQQAYYNAEAGLEVAKRYLREKTAWTVFLPPARNPISGIPTPTWTPAGRDFENFDCDNGDTGETADFQGYGVVLNLPGFGRFENVSAVLNQTLNGSYTVWIRRPHKDTNDGTVQDYDFDDRLVITSEGTAPFVGAAAASDFAFRRRAVRVLEAEITKIDPNDCENRGGQAGNSPTGSGYDPCYAVNAAGLPTGTGAVAAEVNAGQ